jgi:hypothetical protein
MEFCPDNWAIVLDDPEFATLLAKLIRKSKRAQSGTWRLAADAIHQLSTSDLPLLKITRRLTYIFAQLDLQTDESRNLTDAVREMSPRAKSLYASASRNVELAALYTQPGELAPSGPSFTTESDPNQPQEIQSHLGDDLGATALILAMDDFHAGSKSILAEAGFAAIRVQSFETLEQMLQSQDDICAILIDKSFLMSLDADAQKGLFDKIGSYSSLPWIRVDDDGLRISHPEVERILRMAACKSELSTHCLSVVSSGNLRQSELPHVQRACALVKSSDRGVVLPAELSKPELRVVMAAAAEHVRDWQLELPTDLRLHAKLIPGGRTKAKIVLARSENQAQPFVVKVDKREHIHDEMVRFKSFMEPSDGALQPRAVFHNGYGAIVFRLIEGADESAHPAPTLEDALREIRLTDLYQLASAHGPAPTIAAIRTVANKLFRLNSQSPTDSDLTNYSTPSMTMFERLEDAGRASGFSAQAIEARRAAVERYQRLDGCAVVHGDVNLRNILLPGRENANLIDYANTGPGHPAIDLVRLECALLFGPFALMVDMESFRRLQELLTVEWVSLDEIKLEMPEVFQMTVNETVVTGCVLARDAALAVLKNYGGDEFDYRAAKTLIAWSSLEVENLQHAVARMTIDLLTETPAWRMSPSAD